MTKTPEQMAQDKAYELGSNNIEFGIAKDAFLAGYEAGHHAGFESCLKIQEAVTEQLEKQMIDEMYVRMEPLLKEEK